MYDKIHYKLKKKKKDLQNYEKQVSVVYKLPSLWYIAAWMLW